MSKTPGAQVYIRVADKERIEKLAEKEDRSTSLQMKVIVDEACERRGLDPKTLEPIEQSAAT